MERIENIKELAVLASRYDKMEFAPTPEGRGSDRSRRRGDGKIAWKILRWLQIKTATKKKKTG